MLLLELTPSQEPHSLLLQSHQGDGCSCPGWGIFAFMLLQDISQQRTSSSMDMLLPSCLWRQQMVIDRSLGYPW